MYLLVANILMTLRRASLRNGVFDVSRYLCIIGKPYFLPQIMNSGLIYAYFNNSRVQKQGETKC